MSRLKELIKPLAKTINNRYGKPILSKDISPMAEKSSLNATPIPKAPILRTVIPKKEPQSKLSKFIDKGVDTAKKILSTSPADVLGAPVVKKFKSIYKSRGK